MILIISTVKLKQAKYESTPSYSTLLFATENNARHASLDASKQDNRLRVFEKMLSCLYPNWMADEMLVF